MSRIAVIHNPNAKENAKDPHRAQKLAKILGDKGMVYETRVPEEVGPVLDRLRQEGVDVLAICGGDGTYQRVLTDVIKAWGTDDLPPFFLLKGGSMNTNRYSLGAKICAEDSIRMLMHKADAGSLEQEEVHLLDVNGERYGFLFGFGAVIRFLEDYYSSNASGPVRAADTLYKVISGIIMRTEFLKNLTAPVVARTVVDEENLDERKWTMVLAGTLEYIGLGFKPLSRARQEPGRFHLWASGLTPARILAQIHRMFKGQELNGEEHVERVAQRSVFEPVEEDHIAYTLDGELYKAPSIELSYGPRIVLVRE